MKKILPIGIFFLSIVIIFFLFPHLPQNLAFDEIEFAKIALSLDNIGYIPYTTQANGHSTLYFYVILLFTKIFGVTTLALRLPAALFGVGNGLLFYFISRKIFKDNFIVAFATLVLITLRWHFNFARFSFEPTFLLFLELASIYYLLDYLEGKKQSLIFSGLCAGLAFHSYLPGRIFIILPIIILLIHKRQAVARFIAVTAIVMLPLLSYLAFHPDTRVQQTVFLLDRNTSVTRKAAFIGENCRKTSLGFYTQGDMNGRHNFPGKPALNPLVALLFSGGLLISIHQRKKIPQQIFLLYFVLSLAPALLTDPADNPSMIRSFTALAPVAYFCGVAANWLVDRAKKKRRLFAYGLLGIILLISAALELRTYYLFQTRVQRNAFEVTCDLKQMVDLQPKTLKDIPLNCQVTEDLFNQ